MQQAGVEARFEALLEAYGRFLRNVIRQTCPTNLGLQVADIEQEARVRLWRALKSERDLTDAASYIYRVAVTTTIDAVRRATARREDQLSTEAEEGAAGESVFVAAPNQSPDRIAERQLLIGKVEAALSELAENRRIAVEFHLEGMTSQEIADLMNWSEPKARNLIYRGMNDLRKRLREQGIE